MDLVVTYDISTADRAGERRLARVAAVCERYGVRVQYSVFECRLDEIRYEQLISELLDEIKPASDSVSLYRLGSRVDDIRRSLGRRGFDWDRPMIM
jgi:CRISPR-associated protein Cas2